MNNPIPALRRLPPLIALLIGAVLALLALVVAELAVGAKGHRIKFDQLPPEAQAISREKYPNPTSPEQWKRINEVMESHGGWPGGTHLTVLTTRKASFIFLLFPAVAIGVLRLRGVSITPLSASAVAGPSLVALAWAWLVTPHPLLVT